MAALVAAALVFAVMALATKYASVRLPGPQVALVRFVIGLAACALAATRVRMQARNKLGLFLRGAYGVLGASVPLFGGASADGWRMTGGFLFGDGRALTDAVVGVAIGSEAPLSVAVRHGWDKVGDPMIVTSSGDGRVYTLDDRPALDVYLDRLGAPPEAYA